MAAAFYSTSLSCLSTASGPAFCHQVLVAGEQTQWLFVTLQKPQWTPSKETRFVRRVYNPPIHPSIHPSGSEINPFSDRWLVSRGFQTEPQAAGPGGGNNPKIKNKNKITPLPQSTKKNTKWNKTRTEAIGSIEAIGGCGLAHLHESHPLSGCLCVSVWLSATSVFVGGSWGLFVAGVCFLLLLNICVLKAHWAAGAF